MVTHNRVTTLQNHSVSTLSSDQLRQRFVEKMDLNQLVQCLRALSEKAMVLTHLQCLILLSFFLAFLTSDFDHSYMLLVTDNAIQVNTFGMLS